LREWERYYVCAMRKRGLAPREKKPKKPKPRFRYGEHGEYLVTIGDLKQLHNVLKRLQRGEISYRAYLVKRYRILNPSPGSPPLRRQMVKKSPTPWSKIKVYGGGLPELGKR
jgi:hypothetical protein